MDETEAEQDASISIAVATEIQRSRLD